MSLATKKIFRKDINALRAIAVIGVLLFHYKIKVFKGGFSGVDVFFVISGYLMTKIIISGLDRGNFDYGDYMKKRATRIIPALLLVISAVLIAGFILCFPTSYKDILKNSAGSLSFISNILYWKDSNYFAPDSESNFLLHTWSLSVEWQFYLIYPFILILLRQAFKSLQIQKYVFIGFSVLLLLLSFYMTNLHPTASFYLLPTRSWEMMAGGIIFLLEGALIFGKLKRSAALFGYALIFGCFLLLDTVHSWPGILTILPVLGAFLVIAANDNDLFIVNNALVQFLGKISYSLYLWHWPLFVFTQYYGLSITPVLITLMSSAAVLMSYLTFKYIESARYESSKYIVSTSLALIIISIGVHKTGANQLMFDKKILQVATYRVAHQKERDLQYRVGICHISDFEDFNKNECLCFVEGKKNVLLIGDSHMGQLAKSFIKYSKGKDINFLQATASATLPLFYDYQKRDKKSRKLMDFVFKNFIPANASKIDAVILTGSWSGQDKRVLNRELILEGIKKTIQYLEKLGIETIVIGETERYKIPYPRIAARNLTSGPSNNYKYLDSSAYEINDYLESNLDEDYVEVINKAEFPGLRNGNTPYMIDKHHVSLYGADIIVKKVSSSPEYQEMID